MTHYTREAWAQRQLREGCESLEAAKRAQRKDRLARVVDLISDFVADGAIAKDEAVAAILASARKARLDAVETAAYVRTHISSGAGGECWYPQASSDRVHKPMAPDGCPYVLKQPGSGIYMVRRPQVSYKNVDGAHVGAALAYMWPDLELTIEDAKGNRKNMSTAQIMDRYGYTVDRSFHTWYLQGRQFEIDEHGVSTLQIECGTRPTIAPIFHQDVEDWMEQVAGDEVGRLKDWLSQVRRLDKPICALYLMGAPGFGKGMLAEACAQMFGGQVAKYGDVALGDFNAKLSETPIVVLNEKAPAGSDGSRAFRDFVGGRLFSFKQKYLAESTIRVCPRLLIAANNADALRLGAEVMEKDDEGAIGDRILFIKVGMSCREWLQDRGGHLFTDGWVTSEDGSPGIMVEHIQWLVENWEVQRPGKRMLIDGDIGEWMKLAHQRGGLAQDILNAIATACVGHLTVTGSSDPTHIIPGEVVWVSGRLLAESWGALTGSSKNITFAKLGRELGKIATGPGKRHQFPDTGLGASRGRQRAFPLDPEAIIKAAESTGILDVDHLAQRLGFGVVAIPLDEPEPAR